MAKDEIKIYDYQLGKEISSQEMLAQETLEEIEYHIDLKIHQIINCLHQCVCYSQVRDTIMDSEVCISPYHYNCLLNSNLSDEQLYSQIIQKNIAQGNKK